MKIEFDHELLATIHEEYKNEKKCSLVLAKFGDESLENPGFSQGKAAKTGLSFFELMRKPINSINITIFNIIFGNKCKFFGFIKKFFDFPLNFQ